MKYYCQYCGKDYKDVFTLTRCKCPGHPDGVFKGNHVLYEAEEKPVYTCKICGHKGVPPPERLFTLIRNKSHN